MREYGTARSQIVLVIWSWRDNIFRRPVVFRFSARSARQHRAWGASPRIQIPQIIIEPAERAKEVGIAILIRLSPAPRAWISSRGLRPGLYAAVRAAHWLCRHIWSSLI